MLAQAWKARGTERMSTSASSLSLYRLDSDGRALASASKHGAILLYIPLPSLELGFMRPNAFYHTSMNAICRSLLSEITAQPMSSFKLKL